MKPIQSRLATAYPTLSTEQLDNYNAIAQAAMKTGHDLVYRLAESHGANLDRAVWRSAYGAQYPWVNERNLERLFSTGMYYAWKDGVGV